MKKNLLKITGIFLVFLVVYLLKVNSAYAETSCAPLKDTQEGTTHGSTSRFTGESCTNPGQYNGIKTCIGTTGCRYFVSFCTKVYDIYCEERYPELNCDEAPLACNKPDTVQSDISKVFGQIVPPVAIQNFGSGSAGISKFLSNFVVLIYAVAAIVLIFMLLWGAFDWMVSGGDKEAVAKARSRILNAFIGILLFAVTFAVLQVLGQFTGFTFFSSPK